MNTTLFKDIVEPNGRTIEQNNLAKAHKYPIGTLVSFDTDEFFRESEKGNCQTKTSGALYVMEHLRDCDGSPLYSIGNADLSDEGSAELYHIMNKRDDLHRMVKNAMLQGLFHMIRNIGEESLTPVKEK